VTLRLIVTQPDDTEDLAWKKDGDCRGMDPDVFFPLRGEDWRPAVRVCRECPVRVECGEYALTNREPFGVWGGLTERKRTRIRNLRRDGVPVVLS
jgi:WhiB family redox-sensing transcriptional regulator